MKKKKKQIQFSHSDKFNFCKNIILAYMFKYFQSKILLQTIQTNIDSIVSIILWEHRLGISWLVLIVNSKTNP